LLKEVLKCDIAVSLQNSLFDHKAILLDFNNHKGKPVIRQRINNKVLQSDLLEIVVLTSTAETYIQNAVFIPNRDNLLRIVGQLKLIIHNAGLNWCERPGEAVPEEAVRAREGLLNTARYNLQILNIEVLENAALVCVDDIFMETLVNNIRNDTCNFQAFFLREAKKKFADGVKTLNTLKENYSDNEEQIKNLEAVLNVIADRELRAELENFAIFEHLSSEKMCPKFLTIVKNSNPVPDLSVIRNDTDEEFNSDPDRKSISLNILKIYIKRRQAGLILMKAAWRTFLVWILLIGRK
jgi:hypothetical protein